ncbi:MAG: ferrous iron transporter B [Candidatus Altiarchaeales archaeon HGW-Altiarchaeales-1]|nr:MAG: ferrous iron transporter B [Candidatus Altiarchaeales archaeon HGW-Altiarchaeales-1]
MHKILLVGNPNVGNVIISNYPGTTVDWTKGSVQIEGKIYELIDTPGTYSIEPTCEAEEVTAKQISEMKDNDIIINVVDATNLERNLYLTLGLLETGKPMLIALNLWDDTKHKGIDIDVEKLKKFLQVPVITTSGLTGTGIKNLIEEIKNAGNPNIHKHTTDEKWKDVGKLVMDVQKVKHRHHTIIEKFEDLTIKPVTGIPIAIIVLFLTFAVVGFIGEGLIKNLFDPLFENFYLPVIENLADVLKGNEILYKIFIGTLIDGKIDLFASLGALTSGVYIPLAAVLAYIIAFYLILGILEDSGYLPRLNVLTDSIFHKFGLHGFGIVPAILGLGCRVPGVMATRVFETRKQRFIAITMLAISVPCAAQTAALLSLWALTENFNYICVVFAILLFIYVINGILLNKFIKGESPEILLEIPPYRKPTLMVVLKKLWMRVKVFIFKAFPIIFLGVMLLNILDIIGLTDILAIIAETPFEILFGLPAVAALPLATGFLRKELAVGMLIPLVVSGALNMQQLIIASVLVVITFPCIATFGIMFKEMKKTDILLFVFIAAVNIIVVGVVLKILLMGI